MKILFLTHDTSRTGAPMVLLGFLKWIQVNHPNIEIHCLALEGGELEEEFSKVSKSYTNLSAFKKPNETAVKRIHKKILRKVGTFLSKSHPREEVLKIIAGKHFDLIYANTVVCLPIASKLKILLQGPKLILHLHELNNMINELLPDFNRYLKNIDFYIAASGKVKKNLINTYGISSEYVEILYEFTKICSIETHQKVDPFIIGGAGTINFRKGTDLFVSVAAYIHRNYPDADIKFVWVGSGDRNLSNMLNDDIIKLGIGEIINFVGSKENPEHYFRQFDVFLMTSREDPFPLVCIEAGMLKKPIISFENATGTEEILRKGGGKIVPYLDQVAMAKAIIEYYGNKEILKRDGEKAFELFSEFSPEKQCPKLLKLLQSNL